MRVSGKMIRCTETAYGKANKVNIKGNGLSAKCTAMDNASKRTVSIQVSGSTDRDREKGNLILRRETNMTESGGITSGRDLEFSSI